MTKIELGTSKRFWLCSCNIVGGFIWELKGDHTKPKLLDTMLIGEYMLRCG